MSRTTCRICGEPLEPRLGTGGSGRSGGATVELGPYLARTCPVGHLRHFPAPGFGGALRDGLAAVLPVALACPGCGAAGEPGAVRTEVTVPVDQGEPALRGVRVVVEVPAHACPCGVTWVEPGVDDDLGDALVGAFLGLRP